MFNPHIKLFVYAGIVAAACVEVLGSVEAGVWHSPLYWTAVAAVIPLGFLGILLITKAHTPPQPLDTMATLPPSLTYIGLRWPVAGPQTYPGPRLSGAAAGSSMTARATEDAAGWRSRTIITVDEDRRVRADAL